jgi:hypothetical protein
MLAPEQTVDGPLIVPADGAEEVTLKVVNVVAVPQLCVLVTVKTIVSTPVATPATAPVDASTVATAVLVLLHAPVPLAKVVLASVVPVPGQTEVVPVMAPATGSP